MNRTVDKSDAHFLNALREVLGLGPLPHTEEAGIETDILWGHKPDPDPGWPSAETDGNKRTPKRFVKC